MASIMSKPSERECASKPRLQDTLAYPPRALDADHAAAYVCLSRSKFLELVDSQDAPQPLDLGGCPRWDRRALDGWVDAKSEYRRKRVKTMAEVLEERRGTDQAGLRQQLQGSPRETPPLLSKARVA
jgi:predicted DNA-binding transcriptional regulator AlpA